ncbi:ferritin family protein [Geobacter pelophilus]|jgi:rubrerythrin|uniref:Ferritin family protein n=1 Tax=Geoanaerobacter pelophilus TaxID=60036 RepID=A0AAW4KWL7_9BACT|nr:ferritin family protein [Geoanaerobacter pelophilus]MBT0662953.1 ferritin family protein [Geoanaerobacter pelophilus]
MGFVTLEEVIKYAVKREEDAVQLYTRAAELTTSIAARKMFEEFVAEEMGHKKVFSQMDLAKAEQYKASKVPDLGISKYLVDLELKPDMSYPQILQFAIKTEENAYQLYKSAAEVTEDPQLKKTLEVFADVELGHKKRIEAIYDERVLTEN